MKKLALGAMCLGMAGFLAACGGGDDDVNPVDASIDGDGGNNTVCNPLSPPGQQGCPTGQKCTWVELTEDPEPLGQLTCAPEGTVALGDACTATANGVADDCVAGLICVSGTCHDICGFDGSANAACEQGYNCTRYADLFANGEDDPVAGACNPGCNPITQMRADGSTCGTNQGCYLLTSSTETIAVCAGAGNIPHNTAITGTAYANSCVPGHQPRRADPNSTTVECGALCQVTDVYMGNNEADEGGTTPYTCESKGASPPSDGASGEGCRYWWAREPFDALSPFSNTVGWCFKHAVWQYDTDGDMTADAPFPRCIATTTGDVLPPIGNPPHNDAIYFWCMALPAMLDDAITNVKKWNATHQPRTDRLGNWH